VPLTLISAIPRILAGNKRLAAAPQAAGGAEDEAGARWFLCAAARGLRRAGTGRATVEAGPIMDGDGRVALAIAEIGLVPPAAVRRRHRAAPDARSVSDA